MVKKITIPIFTSFVLTMICATGLFYNFNSYINDLLYQNSRISSEDIVIIGIDAQSIEEHGVFPWDRKIVADLINVLSNDPNYKPAAIGIDILFTGHTDEQNDTALVDAAKNAGNVVLISAANYTTEFVTEYSDGEIFEYLDETYIESYDKAFDELSDVTSHGHVNSALDKDGILRYAMGDIKLEDGTEVSSFNDVLYEKYCNFHEIEYVENPSINSSGMWYLPYAAPPGGLYDGYSVSSVLAGEVPAEVFDGAVVMIGPYTIGMQDQYRTSIDKTEFMFGVEYQANALNALMDREFRYEISFFMNLVIVFVVSLLNFLIMKNKRMFPLTAIFISVFILWILLCYGLYRTDYLLDVTYVLISTVCIYVISVGTNYVTALVENVKVSNKFKRYVAPEIVAEILKEDEDSLGLSGKSAEISVMFADIRSFTPMTEKLPPETVINILNKILSVCSSNIIAHKGTLDKFIGDSTMAFWGAPLHQEDYVFNSVACALDIVDDLIEVRKEIEKEYSYTISIGIGIHCGTALIGNVGSEIRTDFTAIGDTVNTAARLESNAPANTIYISKEVAQIVSDRINTTKVEKEIPLKGKTGNFEVYRVDSLKK